METGTYRGRWNYSGYFYVYFWNSRSTKTKRLQWRSRSIRLILTSRYRKKRRVDLVYNLADCVKQYDKHEAETLTAIVEGRGKATNLENVTTAITAVTEAYPELKSNENYKELMNELSITENLIAEYRENYNKQIKEYNRYVRKFPTRFFLNILGYETQQYQYLDYGAPVDAPQNLFGD